MSAWVTLAAASALLVFVALFLAGLLLLSLFVRSAALSLLALRDVREQTREADERRSVVSDAERAVEDMRAHTEAYGGSGDPSSSTVFGYASTFGAGSLQVSVPEPATWAMLLLGLGAVGAMARIAQRREVANGPVV